MLLYHGECLDKSKTSIKLTYGMKKNGHLKEVSNSYEVYNYQQFLTLS